MSKSGHTNFSFSPVEEKILQLVGKYADELDYPCYAIGGFVRDKILGRPVKDIDFVCQGSGVRLASRISEALSVKYDKEIKLTVFRNFGTAHFRLEGFDLEFVGARKESYNRGSRKPVVENGSLRDDQLRRDFTINALAIQLNAGHYGELLDPFDGIKDLSIKLIQTPQEPDSTFSDDPLRMLRAIRFSTQLNFKIASPTLHAITRQAERIKIISQERITDELNKIILSDTPSRGFKLLEETGLLKIIFPEMVRLKGVDFKDGKGHKDNFYHTLQVLDNLTKTSDDLWLRWAAILHDIAKPPTKRFHPSQGWTFHGHEVLGARWVPGIFRRMKLPLNEPMRFVQNLVLLHLRPISLTKENVSDSAIRRLLFEAGDDIDSLMKLCEADITSKNRQKVQLFLDNFEMVRSKLEEVESKDQIRNWQPPISGEKIMEVFGIKPGKEVGIIKNAIREAILDGEITNDLEGAHQFMLNKGKELGLSPV